MIIPLALIASVSLEPPKLTDEQMAIFANNKMLILEERYNYNRKTAIEILLEDEYGK